MAIKKTSTIVLYQEMKLGFATGTQLHVLKRVNAMEVPVAAPEGVKAGSLNPPPPPPPPPFFKINVL